MGTPKKALREPLNETWAAALLSAPDASGKSIWGALQEARAALQVAVTNAREALADNPLRPTVTEAVARQKGWRGKAAIVVDSDGTVTFEVAEGVAREVDSDRRPWRTDLPALEALREEAIALGLDIRAYGRSKRKIADAIAASKTTVKTPQVAVPAPQKRVKTAPAISGPTIIHTTPPATPAIPGGGNGKGTPLVPVEDLLPEGMLDGLPPPSSKLAQVLKESDEIDLDSILEESSKKP